MLKLDYITADLFIETVQSNVNRQLKESGINSEINISQVFTCAIGHPELELYFDKEKDKNIYQINIPVICNIRSNNDAIKFKDFILWAKDLFYEIECVYQLTVFGKNAVFIPNQGIYHDYHYTIFESAICNISYSYDFSNDIEISYINKDKKIKNINVFLYQIDAEWQSQMMCYEELSNFLNLDRREKISILEIFIDLCRNGELFYFFEKGIKFSNVQERIDFIEEGFKGCINFFFEAVKTFKIKDDSLREIDVFDNSILSKESELEQNFYIIQGAAMSLSPKWKNVNDMMEKLSASSLAFKEFKKAIGNTTILIKK